MRVAIIDYGSGNLHSAAKAFQHVAEGLPHRPEIIVTSDADALRTATHIVLPGVGAFGDCMRGLQAVNGMVDAMREAVIQNGKPFFGICVGMQMMLEEGHEHGVHQGLGWIEGKVVKITPNSPTLKIPHMGWNDLVVENPSHPMLANIKPNSHAYFVHSYHADCAQQTNILATVYYGDTLAACIGRDNLFGTQFHPEKSQHTGLSIIGNFLRS